MGPVAISEVQAMDDVRSRSLLERLNRVEFLVVMALLVALWLIAIGEFNRTLGSPGVRVCQSNLRAIGQALAMYADESRGELYPHVKGLDCRGKVQPWSGALDLSEVYPDYMADMDLLVCPAYPLGKTAVEVWDGGKTTNPRWEVVKGFSNNGEVEPCEVLAKPYYYYGWAFSEKLFQAAVHYRPREPEDHRSPFVKDQGIPVITPYDSSTHTNRFRQAILAQTARMRSGEIDSSSEMWEMTYATGTDIVLPRGSEIPILREGVERYYIDEIGNPAASSMERARIVVLHEELFESSEQVYHSKGRLNVLYMDGHVASLRPGDRWNAPFPLNEAGYLLHDAVEGTLEGM